MDSTLKRIEDQIHWQRQSRQWKENELFTEPDFRKNTQFPFSSVFTPEIICTLNINTPTSRLVSLFHPSNWPLRYKQLWDTFFHISRHQYEFHSVISLKLQSVPMLNLLLNSLGPSNQKSCCEFRNNNQNQYRMHLNISEYNHPKLLFVFVCCLHRKSFLRAWKQTFSLYQRKRESRVFNSFAQKVNNNCAQLRMQYRFPVEVRPGEKLNSYHFAPTVWKIKEISYIAKSIVQLKWTFEE